MRPALEYRCDALSNSHSLRVRIQHKTIRLTDDLPLTFNQHSVPSRFSLALFCRLYLGFSSSELCSASPLLTLIRTCQVLVQSVAALASFFTKLIRLATSSLNQFPADFNIYLALATSFGYEVYSLHLEPLNRELKSQVTGIYRLWVLHSIFQTPLALISATENKFVGYSSTSS